MLTKRTFLKFLGLAPIVPSVLEAGLAIAKPSLGPRTIEVRYVQGNTWVDPRFVDKYKVSGLGSFALKPEGHPIRYEATDRDYACYVKAWSDEL